MISTNDFIKAKNYASLLTIMNRNWYNIVDLVDEIDNPVILSRFTDVPLFFYVINF